MRSMTGFGRASAQEGDCQVTATLRTVNHRHLDLAFRGRDDLRELEPAVRELIAKRLKRGRVEIQLEATLLAEENSSIQVDQDLLRALVDLGNQLQERDLITASKLQLADLLRVPNLIKLDVRNDAPWQDDQKRIILGVIEQALDQLVAARGQEGGKLQEILQRRLGELAQLHRQMIALQEGVSAILLSNLRGRIDELLGSFEVVVDDGRLAQEAALLVDRLDITEELDRLESHLEHFATITQAKGSIGKRLDFLTQEIFRELNTIGSKCRDSDVIRLVLDGKVLCEQLREQIQNVE